MSNQAVEPGNTGDIFYFMRVLLFILLLSMGYALSRPRPVGEKEQAALMPDTETLPQYQQWPRLLPWQRKASERAIEAIRKVPGVVTPFPGGLCRSGSKVGSTYAFLRASTNTPFCPAIKHTFPDSQVPDGVNCVLEVVLNGLDEPSVKRAMAEGIRAAVEVPGVLKITAVNFGGKLGKFQMGLKDSLGVE